MLALLIVAPLTLGSAYAVDEQEPNDDSGSAQDLKGLFETGADPDIGNKTTNTSASIPHVTIEGRGDAPLSPDVFTFNVTQAGTGIFDIDYGNLDFDAERFGIATQLDGTIWVKNEKDFYRLDDRLLPKWAFTANYGSSLHNTLTVHPGTGDFYSFSRGNTRIIRIDPNTGASTAVGATGIDDLTALAFNAEGRLFATTGTDDAQSALYELNPDTGAVIESIGDLDATPVKGIDFHPQTGTLYASSGEGYLDLRNSLAADSTGTLYTIARQSNSNGVEDSILYRLDRDSNEAVRIGPTGLPNVSSLAFDDADQLFAITGRSRSISILYRLDPNTGAVLETIGNTGLLGVTGIDFEPDTGTLYAYSIGPGSLFLDAALTTSSDGTFHGIEQGNDEHLVTIDDAAPHYLNYLGVIGASRINAIAMNADDRLFMLEVTGGRGSPSVSTLLELDPADGSLIERIGPIGIESVTSLAFDPDSGVLYGHANARTETSARNSLASDQAGNFYSVVDIDDSEQLVRFDPATWVSTLLTLTGVEDLTALAFDSGDRLFGISGSRGNASTLYEFDPSTGEVLQIIGVTGLEGVTGLDFQPGTDVLYAHVNGPSVQPNNTLAFDASGDAFTVERDSGAELITFDPDTGDFEPLGSVPNYNTYALAFDGAGRLFAALDGNGGSRLVELNPATGGLVLDIGPIGFERVTGLAFHPDSGVLYGHSLYPNQLITVDTVTGTGTLIGNSNTSNNVSDIAFDPDTDVLYGMVPQARDIVTFDLGTGASSVLGDVGTNTNSCGLGHDASRLVLKCQSDVFEIDKGTGVATPLSTISAPGQLYTLDPTTGAPSFVAETNAPGNISDMSFDPDMGGLFGWVRGDVNDLATIDLLSGDVALVGDSGFSGSRVGMAFSQDTGDLVIMSYDDVLTVDKGTGFATDLAIAFRNLPKLITIDIDTGAGTIVGPSFLSTPTDGGWGYVSDLAFDRGPGGNPYEGTLYGIHGQDNAVFTFNMATGEATLLGPSGLGNSSSMGLAHNGDGLFIVQEDNFYEVDQSDGSATFSFLAANEYSDDNSLFTLNANTAQPALIGPTGYGNVSDLAFDEDGTLFGWYSGDNQLLTIATDTGVGTTVADPPDEYYYSTGIAFDPVSDQLFKKSGERLYQVDRMTAAITEDAYFPGRPSRLYTLDPETGDSTLIGNAHGFYSGLPDITFADDGTLYGFDTYDSDSLVTYDLGTGATTRLWRVYSSDGGLAFDPQGRLWFKHDDDDLFIIDLATGHATFALAMEDRDQDNQLAIDSTGVFYTVDDYDEELFTIDPTTGALTFVGNLGARISAITFDADDRLYGITGVDAGGDNILYEFDPETGAQLNTIGNTGRLGIDSLDFNPANGMLYAYDQVAGELLTVNPATADVAVIAAVGIDDVEDMAFAPDGRLFGFHNSSIETIFEFDISTGAATFLAEQGDFDSRLVLLDTDGTTVLAEATATPFTWGAEGSNREYDGTTQSRDAYLEYDFTTPGKYYIRVQEDDTTTIPFGATYRLQISLPGGQGQVMLIDGFEN